MVARNITYQNPINQEENTPLVTILETRVQTQESTAVDSRKAQYIVDLTKASFGAIYYPRPGTQWYLKKISGVWALMARAPRQNPQLDPSLNPQPGETYIGGDGQTVFVGDVKINGNNTSFSMIGEIRMWPTVTAPSSWQLCDGTSLLRATYPTLFALLQPVLGTVTMTIASPCVVSFTGHGLSIGDRVFFTTTGALPTGVSSDTGYWVIAAGFGPNSFQISTTLGGSAVNTSGSQSGVHTLSRTYFGVADPTHFNVPDYRGRVPVGRDSSQTEFAAVGETGGEKAHVLTSGEMPSHTHPQFVTSSVAPGSAVRTDYTADAASSAFPQGVNTGAAGGDGAHNNLQPYIAINYIIKLL